MFQQHRILYSLRLQLFLVLYGQYEDTSCHSQEDFPVEELEEEWLSYFTFHEVMTEQEVKLGKQNLTFGSSF